MGLQNYLENRRIKKYLKIAERIVKHHQSIADYTDEQLQNETQRLKELVKQKGCTDQVRNEIFAVAREGAKRILGLEAYPVQLVGGLILSEGNVAEMKTGEGKTLVSLFSIYYEAVCGTKVHVITANDYLAARDKEHIGQVLEFLGLTVGLVHSGQDLNSKKETYEKDVVYGTASEFGFDYLRDNMTQSPYAQVQKGLDFVLIDEADSILIDEARTPLIISGKKQEDLSFYVRSNLLVTTFKKEDYEYNIETNSVWMTDSGIEKTERYWGINDLYDLENQEFLRFTTLSLRAHITMKKERDYVVRDGEILLVDQNTGRIMDGRRFSEGLHQAIEAKELVEVKDETRTLATVTIQNYFRMYQKIAGMTGTAKTEEEELQKIYGLDVLVVPTHRPIARLDDSDEIYLTKTAKHNAIVSEVKSRIEKGQPVLVGTSSIEDNELLSAIFTKNGISHQVLNAKNHEREAEIIALAGERGAVTLATNMAGRGTDIKLGEGVIDLGGLAVIGTEKHDSRRVDNQLKGRSGRQGDVGYSKFILSLEDDLIQKFNGQRIKDLADKLNFPEDEPIKHKMVAKAINGAQKRMEGANFDIRKNLLEYDEVMDSQRKFIYAERKKIMKLKETDEFTKSILEDFVRNQVQRRFDPDNTEPFEAWVTNELVGAIEQGTFEDATFEEVEEKVLSIVLERYEEKRKKYSHPLMNSIERSMFLDLLDQSWIKHLETLSRLKEGIHLRAYAQTNPLNEYKLEASDMFNEMLEQLRFFFSMNVIRFQMVQAKPVQEEAQEGVPEETGAKG